MRSQTRFTLKENYGEFKTDQMDLTEHISFSFLSDTPKCKRFAEHLMCLSDTDVTIRGSSGLNVTQN